MADINPIEQNDDRDQRIRERAYALWEADGKPHGRHIEYWERASELVRMEESAGAGQIPLRESTTEIVEEAFIQENLGEFPGLQTDQGDALPTPAPKKKRAPAKPKK